LIPLREVRESIIKSLIVKFERVGRVSYPISETTSLHLLKNKDEVRNKGKYPSTPFPLLTNIEYFQTSLGDFNAELLKHGIQTRTLKRDSQQTYGTQIYLIKEDISAHRINTYLKSQYKRLTKYVLKRKYNLYWKLTEDLQQHS